MPHPVVEDPSNHARPFRLSTLKSAPFLHPGTRRLVNGLAAIMGPLCALFVVVGSTAASPSLPPHWAVISFLPMSLMFWTMIWILSVKIYEWSDRRYFPQEFRLAKDKRGLGLLLDGSTLDCRRRRLIDDGESCQPLVRPDETQAAWEEQRRQERELRTRQEALLHQLGTT